MGFPPDAPPVVPPGRPDGCRVSLLAPHPHRTAVLVAASAPRLPTVHLDSEEPTLPEILTAAADVVDPSATVLRQVVTSPGEAQDELLLELQLPIEQARKYKFYYGKGCQRCNNSGYKGRTGIYELMSVTDDIRDMVTSDASIDDMRNMARMQGMTTLREAGLKLIFDGVTTIDEVVRETVMEDLD